MPCRGDQRPDEPTLWVRAAEKFKELPTAAAAQPSDDSKITALKAEAQKAIQNGEFGKADEISFATVNRPTTFGRRFTNPVAYRRAASSGSSAR